MTEQKTERIIGLNRPNTKEEEDILVDDLFLILNEKINK